MVTSNQNKSSHVFPSPPGKAASAGGSWDGALPYLETSAFLTWSCLPLEAPLEAVSSHIPETCSRVSSSESGFFRHSQFKADGE